MGRRRLLGKCFVDELADSAEDLAAPVAEVGEPCGNEIGGRWEWVGGGGFHVSRLRPGFPSKPRSRGSVAELRDALLASVDGAVAEPFQGRLEE